MGCPWNIQRVLSKRQIEIRFRSLEQKALATGIDQESQSYSKVYWELISLRKIVELDRSNIWGN